MKDRKSGDMEEWPKDLQRSSDKRIPASISVGKVIKAEIAEPVSSAKNRSGHFESIHAISSSPYS